MQPFRVSAMPTAPDPRVFATCVATLYKHSPRVLAANVVNALVVGAILWDTAEPNTITLWWVAMVVMVGVRVRSARVFKRRQAARSISRWATRFTFGSLISGLIWGLGAVALFPADDGPSQVLLAFVVGGMSAGASSSVASHLPAFYAFLIPAVLPLTVRFAIVGDKFHIGMAFMLGLFAALVGAIGRTTHRTLQESYRLRFSNEELVGRLDRHHAQRLDAVGRLTGGIAHDFNNLLTVIVNSLELLDARAPAKRARELVRPALDAALRGGELTRSLLAFSRRQELRPEVVDVYGVVQRLVTTMLRRVLPESIEVSVNPSDGPLLARVDPVQLESALLNLAVNARDAMPDGGALVFAVDQVRIDDPHPGMPVGDYVCVCVADTGTGLDGTALGQVFEPFFTTKGDQGTGLGLSMVYGFVRQSGGAIKLDSVEGEGTTARILLPRYVGDALPSARQRGQAPALGRGELILVVEDEASVRALTVQSLRSLGYRTLEAADATAALALLDDNEGVQLVMSDVVMPGRLNGIALARKLQAHRPDIRVLIASGYSESTEAPGPWPTLAKPYRRDGLARAIAGALSSNEATTGTDAG